MNFDRNTYLTLFDKYINKTATEAEKIMLLEYVRADKHLQEWMKQQVLAADDSTLDSETRMRMLASIRADISKPKTAQRHLLKSFLRVAAMIAVPLLSAIAVYFYMSSNVPDTSDVLVKVERGQKATVTLPDGTMAYLNSETELQYATDYNKTSRDVKLRGEAYFEVAKNAEKPFIVHADDVNIQALGTAFNVKAYPEMMYVSAILAEGKIAFSAFNYSVVLTPNQEARFNKQTGKIEKETLYSALQQIDWRNNSIHFSKSSLGEVGQMLGRIYNIDVRFANEQMKQYSFTGTFQNNSLETILKTISLSAPIKYTLEDGYVMFDEVEKEKRYFMKR